MAETKRPAGQLRRLGVRRRQLMNEAVTKAGSTDKAGRP